MTVAIPTLETERLILRAPCMDDLPYWQAFTASPRAEFIGGAEIADPGTSWRAFAHVAGMWMLRGYGSFVIADKTAPNHPLGLTGPWHPTDWPEGELGWTVWEANNEGTGLAFEAATAARSYAYETLGWTTAVSYIDARNTRSIALARRLGCTLDPDAPRPEVEAGETILVYRHPAPEALK